VNIVFLIFVALFFIFIFLLFILKGNDEHTKIYIFIKKNTKEETETHTHAK